ncbi:MAG: hypothetical protein OQK03_04155, partial [Colwellia sp.]|nr:hypothetical protein [Colwellia sp.]
LKAFPQHSPYTESALFLFAFSAQQTKQYTTALSLLTLLHKQYPHSNLGWQAGLLMAKQVTEQKGLVSGWKAYLQIEQFFLASIESLNALEQSFTESSDLLQFSTITSSNKSNNNTAVSLLTAQLESSKKPYTPDSLWLQKAMYDPSLSSLYQQLSTLSTLNQHCKRLQSKSDWIAETITLNKQRKARIAASQTALVQQGVLNGLFSKREELSAELALALADPKQSGIAFANDEEQVWLDRLHRSQKLLTYIIEHSEDSEQANIADYQQRLTRINAVLAWQLKQRFPQRAWQHKKQLTVLDKNLKQTEALHTNISLLSAGSSEGKNNHSLAQFISRQTEKDRKVNQLLAEIKQLQGKVSAKIRVKVASYLDEQRTLLSQHLLSTRSAMASVLESMSENDKKIEGQLNLNEQAVKEQAL